MKARNVWPSMLSVSIYYLIVLWTVQCPILLYIYIGTGKVYTGN